MPIVKKRCRNRCIGVEWSNNAGQWRAATDNQMQTEAQSACPLEQPGYADNDSFFLLVLGQIQRGIRVELPINWSPVVALARKSWTP